MNPRAGTTALLCTIIACAEGASSTVASANSRSAGATVFVIQRARVFDGENVLPNTTVLVRDGRIAEIGTKIEAPSGAVVIDGEGRTLLPGLIDAHAHVWSDEQLRQALAFGVTTELDMMTAPKVAAHLREQVRKDPTIADLRSAGNPATSPGGHGTEYGLALATLSSPSEAEAFVEARRNEGSDYLKIIYEPGRKRFSTIDRSTLQACVAAAHRRGMLAVVHISTLAGARDALEAGADGLAHVFANQPATEALATLAAKKHAFVVPTLSVNASVYGPSSGPTLAKNEAVSPYLSAAASAGLMQTFPLKLNGDFRNAKGAVASLAAHGVPILAGTDAPNPGTAHGASMQAELALLVEAGLSPLQALAAATSAPAKQFHLNDRGRIAVGLRADLLLVRGDPTQDIRAVADIEGIWRGGARFDRDGYRRWIAADVASNRGALPTNPLGMISSFDEEGAPRSTFGSGWRETTDALAGGHSTAALATIRGGAKSSSGALEVTGVVAVGLPYAWAGAMFFPGVHPMEAADLSASKSLSFHAKGDGRSYRLMVFAKRLGRIPATRAFAAGPEWSEHRVTFAELGLDATDIIGIAFCAGPDPGRFRFVIDEVALEGATSTLR